MSVIEDRFGLSGRNDAPYIAKHYTPTEIKEAIEGLRQLYTAYQQEDDCPLCDALTSRAGRKSMCDVCPWFMVHNTYCIEMYDIERAGLEQERMQDIIEWIELLEDALQVEDE